MYALGPNSFIAEYWTVLGQLAVDARELKQANINPINSKATTAKTHDWLRVSRTQPKAVHFSHLPSYISLFPSAHPMQSSPISSCCFRPIEQWSYIVKTQQALFSLRHLGANMCCWWLTKRVLVNIGKQLWATHNEQPRLLSSQPSTTSGRGTIPPPSPPTSPNKTTPHPVLCTYYTNKHTGGHH